MTRDVIERATPLRDERDAPRQTRSIGRRTGIASRRPAMDESKRSFIKRTVGFLTASGLAAGAPRHAEAVEPPEVPSSMKAPGAGMGEYGSPARYESKVTRTLIRSQ